MLNSLQCLVSSQNAGVFGTLRRKKNVYVSPMKTLWWLRGPDVILEGNPHRLGEILPFAVREELKPNGPMVQ